MLNYLPKYFTSKAITLYIGVLVLVNIVFINRSLPVLWWIFGIIEVVSFFYFSNTLTKKWANFSEKGFQKKIFSTSLLIRVIWVIFSYFFYTIMTGQPFEFSAGDAKGYHDEGMWIVDLIKSNQLDVWFDKMRNRPSDSGYTFYLGWQYFITGNSIIIERLLKALFGAYTVVLIYKLTARNFGQEVGRMAGIFTMLMPNLILYTGLHLKEVNMLLLTVLYIERADFLIRSNNFKILNILPPLIVGLSLFFFRTVLGATAIFALFTTLFFSSNRVVSMNKRLVFITWFFVALLYFVGGRISTEVEEVWQSRASNQDKSLEFRAERENGNKFATYASKSIFAPLIFVIPFPTIINTPGQENQQLINGGNYVKNIMAFFSIFALIMMVSEKKWQDHLLIITFTIGYLISIALSAFAQSERFHQPALPFIMLLAAYGVSKITNKEKKYFTWYMAFIFVAIVAWSWFKLAGRGLA